jgi:acetyl-CoA acyltransferase
MTNVVIAAYRRSPFHFSGKGDLAKARPDEMAATVARRLVEAPASTPRRSRTSSSAAPSPKASRG